MQEVPAEPVQPPKRQMFRPSDFFKNMLQQKEAEKEKKEAEAAQRPSVKVAAEIHPQPPGSLVNSENKRSQASCSQRVVGSV